MSGDGSKQRYVSTFRIHIKSPHASAAPGNGPGTIDTRTTEKGTDTGKGGMREAEINNSRLCVCVGKRSTGSIYHVINVST